MQSLISKKSITTYGFFLVFLSTLIYLFIIGFSVDEKYNISQQPKYSQVRIFITTPDDMNRLTQVDLHIDHADRKEGFIETWLSEEEINLLKKSGLPYQILIEDWYQYYESQPKMSEAEIDAVLRESRERYNISHSIFGTMGGHLKLNEVIRMLDSMRVEYPHLISAKFSIGNSFENRPIWTVRMSTSPNAPTGRPEVWYHALIHAREPMAMMQMMYFMYWLLENYNIDPVATYILRNRELYFTPVLNPDGYFYNETTNPNGGGMWRKNRKPCSGGTGTDLNRNYGIYEFWNSPNGGSSTSCPAETYRGTLPFSEPETQAAMNFVNSRNFKCILDYHTYGNFLIRPWGWTNSFTPDEPIYFEWTEDMTQYNAYKHGRADQLLYSVRGITCDWYYHDSGHTKAFAMTPEVGLSTFWPAQSLILPYAQENLWPNQYWAMVAGPFIHPLSITPNKETYIPNETGTLRVRFRNKGLMTAQNVRIEWVPNNTPYITIPTQVYTRSSVASFVSDSVTFNFTLTATAPSNHAIPTRLRIRQNDTSIVFIRDIYIPVGGGNIVLADSAEQGFGNWTTNQTWGITTQYFYSPTRSFTDSPGGNYSNNANNSMTLAFPINVSTNSGVFLEFWHRYQTDANRDVCLFEVSRDNGSTWHSMVSYSGTMTTWTKQIFDITQVANATTQLRFRFRLKSDGSTTSDGWYVDDIKLRTYQIGFTGISSNNQIPLTYALHQNYPNPFNPTTIIKFQIAKDEFVNLKVYDILGREVATIVNENKKAGYYEAIFDGSGFASGIYFYRIQAGDFIEVKRMLMIK